MDNVSHWHIVGQGAIGLLWANTLSQHHQVSLILRQNHLNDATITYDYTKLDNSKKPLQVNIAKIDSSVTIKKLLVPTKAYDVLPALRQLQPNLATNCTILLCHNGMGTIAEVKQLLTDSQSLYFATTTHGAYKPSINQVIHSGNGQTQIGLIQGEGTLIDEQGLLTPLQWQDNIETTLWTKLAINCAINPLTAIHNCRNGELNQRQHQVTLQSICQEFTQVANHCGQSFKPQQLFKQIQQVITATANNYSSMHQDIHHGRTSEIDYITGFIIQQAAKLNLSVPTHELIYRQLIDVAAQNQ